MIDSLMGAVKIDKHAAINKVDARAPNGPMTAAAASGSTGAPPYHMRFSI